MSRKRLNIFLIPMAILLWIVIFLRILSITRPQRVDEIVHLSDQIPINESNTSDTLILFLNYPDPFNTNRFIPDKPASPVQKKSSNNFLEKQAELPIPSVSFQGTIYSGERSKNVALLVVNGKSVLVSANDSVWGGKVIDCWIDSVRLKFDKRIIIVKH